MSKSTVFVRESSRFSPELYPNKYTFSKIEHFFEKALDKSVHLFYNTNQNKCVEHMCEQEINKNLFRTEM